MGDCIFYLESLQGGLVESSCGHSYHILRYKESNMDTSHFSITSGIGGSMWFIEIVIGIVVLVASNYLFKRVVKHVRHRSLSITHDWKEKIDHILFCPFQILLWILGCTLVFDVLGHRFGFSFFESYINAFRSSGFLFCATWALLRWKAVIQSDLLNKDVHRRKIDAGFMQAIGKIASVVIIVITLMIILQVWGLDVGPLIAFGGIGAAAIGFAGKDVIANFCGGIMLHINRPFMVGDFIHLPSQQVEGHVEEIGWSLTRVRDKEKRPVYLPNAIFSSVLVVNASRMTHRRIEEKVGIRYEDFPRIPELVESLKRVISAHPCIDVHLPVLVVFNGFNQCALDLYIDIYTLETRYDKYLMVRHEVLMLVYQELANAGVEMPIPMMSISGRVATLQESVTLTN